MENPIIKKENCGEKIPVVFTRLRKPTDQDCFIQYILFYWRTKYYKRGKTKKPVTDMEKGWKQYHLPIIRKLKKEIYGWKVKMIKKAKKDISRFEWKEALRHPNYPITYI